MSFSPDEMADLIVKLLTPGHEYLTGSDIIMDGGKYAMSVTKQMEESSARWAAVPPACIIKKKKPSPQNRPGNLGRRAGGFFLWEEGKSRLPFSLSAGQKTGIETLIKNKNQKFFLLFPRDLL